MTLHGVNIAQRLGAIGGHELALNCGDADCKALGSIQTQERFQWPARAEHGARVSNETVYHGRGHFRGGIPLHSALFDHESESCWTLS